MVRVNLIRRSWWAWVFIAVLAVPAYSQIPVFISYFLPGVDAAGNLSDGLGNNGLGRSYYDPATGIVLLYAGARVTNNSGFVAIFENTGFTIHDPATNEDKTATTDLLAVSPPLFRRFVPNAVASLVAVYDPGTGTGTDTGTATATGTGTGTDTGTATGDGTGTATATTTTDRRSWGDRFGIGDRIGRRVR